MSGLLDWWRPARWGVIEVSPRVLLKWRSVKTASRRVCENSFSLRAAVKPENVQNKMEMDDARLRSQRCVWLLLVLPATLRVFPRQVGIVPGSYRRTQEICENQSICIHATNSQQSPAITHQSIPAGFQGGVTHWFLGLHKWGSAADFTVTANNHQLMALWAHDGLGL